jgi:hypothetical protein
MRRYLSAQLLDATPGLGGAGEVIRFALNPSDVHIAHEIDNFLAGFAPQGYRCDEAVPPVLVDKATDRYRTFSQNNIFKQVEVRTSRQAHITEVDIETELSTYLVDERALGAFIPRATENQATFDVKAAHAMRIMEALMLDREIRIFGSGGLLTTSGNWNANNVATIGAGAEWNDEENSNPILDIQERIEASAQLITAIHFNPTVAHAFLRSRRVREHMRQMLGDNAPNPGVVAGASIQQNVDFVIPGLPPFKVNAAKVLNETTGLLEYVLTDSVVLVSLPRNSALPIDGKSTMTAVSWRERGLSGNGITTREFDLQTRGLQGGTMMVTGHAEEEVMISNTCGGLILDAIQEAA